MAAEALQLNASLDPRLIFGRELEGERDRLDFAGALIDRVDLTDAMGRIRAFLRNGAPQQIVTVNLDFLTIAQKDARFRDAINTSDLAVADGRPLVWLSRLRGRPLPQRVTGVELVDHSAAIAAERHESVYLLGAAPGIEKPLLGSSRIDTQASRSPACMHHPSGRLRMTKTSASSNRFARRLRSFLFVAFGAPRQDLWIRTHLDRLGVPVAMGVGCVLDLLAGAVQRAPLWVQRGGLEWTYRLAHEPRRLWRRYVREDMPMLGRLLFSSLHNEGDLERLPRGAEGASSHGLPLGFLSRR